MNSDSLTQKKSEDKYTADKDNGDVIEMDQQVSGDGESLYEFLCNLGLKILSGTFLLCSVHVFTLKIYYRTYISDI